MPHETRRKLITGKTNTTNKARRMKAVVVFFVPVLAEQLVQRPIQLLAFSGAVTNGTTIITLLCAVHFAHRTESCGVGHIVGEFGVQGLD